MDFKQAEKRFQQLKARFAAGTLSEPEFKTQLEELMVQDEQGTWWMIGYETGLWYRHDGKEWVQMDPPGSLSQKPTPAVTSTQNKLSNRFWVAGIAGGLCILAIAVFSLGRNAFAYFGFNNPTETATPTLVIATHATTVQTTTATHTSTREPINTLVTATACTSLRTPEDKANVPVVGKITFAWEAIPDANLYDLQITMPNGSSMNFKSDDTQIIRYAESTPMGGEYQWQITAYNANEGLICTSDPFRYTKPEYVKPSRGGGDGPSCSPDPNCELYDPSTCQCISP